MEKFKALPEEARKEIAIGINASADELVAFQKRLAPKRTGDLANSIKKNKGGSLTRYNSKTKTNFVEVGDPDLTVTVTAGDEKAYYAEMIEFGTAPHTNKGRFNGTQHPGTEAQPFFFPAYRALKKRIKGRIARSVRKSARKVAGK